MTRIVNGKSLGHIGQNVDTYSCFDQVGPFLGCKRSLVRIQSSRPKFDAISRGLSLRGTSVPLSPYHRKSLKISRSKAIFGTKMGKALARNSSPGKRLIRASFPSIARLFRSAKPERSLTFSGSLARALRAFSFRGKAGMARLNIEDSLLAGKRFEKLMLRLGSKRAALGAVAEAWLVAQRFWKHSDAGVPRKAWELEELAPELIDVGLAEDRGDFIYIKGSAEHFAWLRQKVEAGKTGAKVTNEKRWGSGEAGREIIDEKSQRRSADVGVRSASPSSSLLSSLPQDSNLKNNLPTAPKKPPLSREVEKAYGVWLETLEHFGIDRTEIALPQETSIARAIGTLGLENVCLALEGARYEKPNEKFDPKRHLSIDRALHRDRHGKSRWEEFKYMALAERKRRASRAETAQGATSSGDEADSYIERERARAAAEFERDFGAGGAT